METIAAYTVLVFTIIVLIVMCLDIPAMRNKK